MLICAKSNYITIFVRRRCGAECTASIAKTEALWHRKWPLELQGIDDIRSYFTIFQPRVNSTVIDDYNGHFMLSFFMYKISQNLKGQKPIPYLFSPRVTQKMLATLKKQVSKKGGKKLCSKGLCCNFSLCRICCG